MDIVGALNGVPPKFNKKKRMVYPVKESSWPLLYQGKDMEPKFPLGGIQEEGFWGVLRGKVVVSL